MEINLDHLIMSPWISHYPHVACSPYMPYQSLGQYTTFDNLVSLHINQRPSFLNGTKVQGGILKPKAIRITKLHPSITPRLLQYQDSCSSYFDELGDRFDYSSPNFVFNPRHIHGVDENLSGFYARSPYLSVPCPYNFHSPSTKHETETIVKNMIHHQNQILQFNQISDYKQHKETTFDTDISLLRRSELHVSSTSSSLTQNISHCQQAIVSPKLVVQKYLQIPFQVISKGDSCHHSKLQESTRKHIDAQKLRTVFKRSRQRSMIPSTRTKNLITTKWKNSEYLKADINDSFKNKHPRSNKITEEVQSKDYRNAHLDSPNNIKVNDAISLSKNSFSYETKELLSKPALHVSNSYEITERMKLKEDKLFYSAQSKFSEDKKAFKCPQCRYITDRKNNLKRHIVTMHQESSKILDCCGMSFQNKAALRDHNTIFHRGGYRCQVCARNFCRKALLRRHLTVHSGQKDFYCNICGYATSHKSNLERHQKVHQKMETKGGTGRKGLLTRVSPRIQTISSDVIFSSLDQRRLCPTDNGKSAIFSKKEFIKTTPESEENLKYTRNWHSEANIHKKQKLNSSTNTEPKDQP